MSPADLERAFCEAIVTADAATLDTEEFLLTVQGHTLEDILNGVVDAIAEGMQAGCAGLDPTPEQASSGAESPRQHEARGDAI